MVFQDGLGSDINARITANNGEFQQLFAAMTQRQLAGAERETKSLPSRHIIVEEIETVEGEFVEGEFVELDEPTQRALPSPKTEREKRLGRYRNRTHRKANS